MIPPIPAHARTEPASDLLQTLLAFAQLSAALEPDRLETSMEQALDVLRQATGADSAELFLTEPTGHDALLTAYRGPFAQSFFQRNRFAPGEGFPGVVIAQQQAITTDALTEDARFLREHVKKKGFLSYVCVPLLTAQQSIGAVGVASRRMDFSTSDALHLLTLSSAPMAIAVQAGLLQAGQTMVPQLPVYAGTEQDFDLFLESVLQQAKYLANADAGSISVFDRAGDRILRRIVDGADPESTGCHPEEDGQHTICPALTGGHGVALWGARRNWAPPCQRFNLPGQASYCLPMRHNDQNVGMIQLIFRNSAPLPPARHVSVLLEYASQVSAVLAVIKLDLEQRFYPAKIPPPLEIIPTAPVAMLKRQTQDRRMVASARLREERVLAEPLLRVHCLGPFEVFREDILLSPRIFKRRKALTLFKILLFRAGKPIANETLIEWLWPETDFESGSNRLHVVMHALRSAIEPGGTREHHQLVQTDGHHYLLKTDETLWVDLAEFQKAVERAQRAEERYDVSGAIAAYDTAVDLYRGDLFEGDEYAEWCLLEREYLRETYLNALQHLAGLFEQSGNIERAIAQSRRILRADPLRETTQRRLIELLWKSGRRDDALRQFELLVRALRQELDIDPLPETLQLMQRIRQNDLT